MNYTTIERLCRNLILDDAVEPYLWGAEEIEVAMNGAIDEWCRDTLCLKDDSSVYAHTHITAGVGSYTLDDRVLRIDRCWRESDGLEIPIITSENYNLQGYPDWRDEEGNDILWIIKGTSANGFRIFPKWAAGDHVVTGSSNVSFAVTTNIITKTGETFTAHFADDDMVHIAGSTSNDGYHTVSSVGTTTMVSDQTLVTELNTSAVLRLVEETLNFEIRRMPLVSMSSLTPTTSPEIPTKYHLALLQGMGKILFDKRDSETYNPRKAAEHTEKFEIEKDKCKRDLINQEAMANYGPHYGTL